MKSSFGALDFASWGAAFPAPCCLFLERAKGHCLFRQSHGEWKTWLASSCVLCPTARSCSYCIPERTHRRSRLAMRHGRLRGQSSDTAEISLGRTLEMRNTYCRYTCNTVFPNLVVRVRGAATSFFLPSFLPSFLLQSQKRVRSLALTSLSSSARSIFYRSCCRSSSAVLLFFRRLF